VSRPEVDAATTLVRHVEWAAPPWLGFVFTPSIDAVETLQVALADEVASSRVWAPRTPQALRSLLPKLLEGPAVDLVWVVAIHDEAARSPPGPWTEALDWLLMRANERRQQLLSAVRGLLFVAPPQAKPRVREAAPDLWSVRAVVVEPPAPAVAAPPPLPDAGDSRVAPIARRIGFHRAMSDDPWVAIIAGRPDQLDALHRALSDRLGAEAPVRWHHLPAPAALLDAAARGELDRPTLLVGSPDAVAQLPAGVTEAARFAADLEALPSPRPVGPTLEELVGPDRVAEVEPLARDAEALFTQGWASEAEEAASAWLHAARALDGGAASARSRHIAGALELRARCRRLLGHAEQALADIEGALRLRRAATRQVGEGEAERRAALARCLSLAGQLQWELGQTESARQALREALDLRRALVAYSDDAEALSDLALTWSLLGDLAGEGDDDALAEAEAAYRETVRLRRRLADETGAHRHRRLLSVGLGRLGRTRSRRGLYRRARPPLQEAVDLATALAAADPGNVGWQMEASVAQTRLADTLQALGELDAAGRALDQAVALRRELLAHDPDHQRWRTYLAVARGRQADLALRRGNLDEAREAADEALSLSEAALGGSPHELRGLALAWLRCGDVARATGDRGQAERCWDRVEALLPALASVLPDRAQALGAALASRRDTS